MHDSRRATLNDLRQAAAWIENPGDAFLWAGSRIQFPIDPQTLESDLQFATASSWCLEVGDLLAAFGQLVPKPGGRQHLARLIVNPARRGHGYGRILTELLVARAKDLGASSVSLNVDPSNHRALSLYDRLGFREAPRPPDEPPSGSRYLEHVI